MKYAKTFVPETSLLIFTLFSISFFPLIVFDQITIGKTNRLSEPNFVTVLLFQRAWKGSKILVFLPDYAIVRQAKR